jgi:hypothetical protein
MASNAKIQLGQLDFDSIKNSLKSFLQSQSQFQDYNFEGAGLNVILDLLSYNTHYNAFYMNMIANEMFMDSATLRSSVVSHAKLLGYTPRSTTSSRVVVDCTITRSPSDTITELLSIPRFTPFISESINGTSYRFLNTTEQTANLSGNQFIFTDLELKEGQESSYVFVVNLSTNPTQTFDLPDYNIDTSTLQVLVQKSASNTLREVYKLAQDATEVTSTSKVFYLEESTSGKYQIYFGDNVIGKQLDDGNLVIVTYIVTNGTQANGLSKFKLQTPLLSGSTSNTVSQGKSSGASLPELVDDIKFSAPKSFIAQNRAVTKNDYIALINKKYPYFDAITVWGGEDEVPPVYGKVFISAKPKLGFEITQQEKDYVTDNIIKPISVLTVTPEFVDPDYVYLNFAATVRYDPSITNKTSQQIKQTIRNAVQTYAAANFNSFNAAFEMSRLLRAIDDSDPSIDSSDVELTLEKQLEPILITSTSYVLDFGTQLTKGYGSTKLYTTPYFELEDSFGITRQCYIEETPNSFTGIEGFNITNPGKNYQTTPTIEIIGDGSGAAAYPVIVNGKIQSVVITNRGVDYTTAYATVSGGGGTLGAVDPIIQGKTGTLRTFYYDTNKNKVVLIENAGTVDYVNGKVYLNSFAPVDVGNSIQTLSFFAKPSSSNFSSSRNRLITYDSNKLSALTIQLIPIGS